MISSHDPTLETAARTLPDPDSLTATQLRALRLARSHRMIMVRGGWKANNRSVSFRTTAPLESLNLVRRVNERARWTLICTGAGLMLLDIVESRKPSKGVKA